MMSHYDDGPVETIRVIGWRKDHGNWSYFGKIQFTGHSISKIGRGTTKKEKLGLGWCQDNGNWSNQESKFDFLATRQCLV